MSLVLPESSSPIIATSKRTYGSAPARSSAVVAGGSYWHHKSLLLWGLSRTDYSYWIQLNRPNADLDQSLIPIDRSRSGFEIAADRKRFVARYLDLKQTRKKSLVAAVGAAGLRG